MLFPIVLPKEREREKAIGIFSSPRALSLVLLEHTGHLTVQSSTRDSDISDNLLGRYPFGRARVTKFLLFLCMVALVWVINAAPLVFN